MLARYRGRTEERRGQPGNVRELRSFFWGRCVDRRAWMVKGDEDAAKASTHVDTWVYITCGMSSIKLPVSGTSSCDNVHPFHVSMCFLEERRAGSGILRRVVQLRTKTHFRWDCTCPHARNVGCLRARDRPRRVSKRSKYSQRSVLNALNKG
jgi:hypothetical protein